MGTFEAKTPEQIEAEKAPSGIDIIEQTQSDLIFTLMMNGVI